MKLIIFVKITNMNNRVKTILEEYNLSASKFADIVGVQASGISHILSGRNKPGYDFIRKVLIAFPEVSSDWLILGNGNMKREITTETHKQSAEGNPSSELNMSIAEEATLFNSQLNSLQSEPAISHSEPVFPMVDRESTVQQLGSKRSPDTYPDKQAEKIIILYSDKSFSEYSPE